MPAVTCPDCRTRFRVSRSAAGTSVDCPGCRKVIRLGAAPYRGPRPPVQRGPTAWAAPPTPYQPPVQVVMDHPGLNLLRTSLIIFWIIVGLFIGGRVLVAFTEALTQSGLVPNFRI